MTNLIITRGLPGSGKSTKATAWVAEDPARRAQVNRDDLRHMMHNGTFIKDGPEPQLVRVQTQAIIALLQSGIDVVCSDTNLPSHTVRHLAQAAHRAGAGLEVWDLTGVPLQTCIARDAARPRPVGEHVIRDMHQRFIAGKTLPLPVPELPHAVDLKPYVRPTGRLRKAFLLDLDGTAALMNGRSPYDLTRVGEDLPNEPILHLARSLNLRGWECIAMSGRDEVCRDETTRWLRYHLGIPLEGLFMRPHGDTRADWIVKYELFNEHVRDRYIVELVVDDRTQVVAMWRRLGLTVAQVADGDF